VAVHRYSLYGLGVHSQVPLWGHEARDCPNDVTVLWHQRDLSTSEGAREAREVVAAADLSEVVVSWQGVGEMSIRSGTEIEVVTSGDVEWHYVRHLVCGVGLGLALHQRGTLALHASAVAIDGRAVAFVGPKGAGKSTLAAALSARGHTLLTDDVVALDLPDDAPPMVRRGPTNLNLWPDSALATGHDPDALDRIWSRSTKVAGWLPTAPDGGPTPLGAIFVLAAAEAAPDVSERLTSLAGFAELVGHTHAFRWVADRRCLPRHLEQCRAVLRHVPMFRVTRGQSFDSLEALVRRVEASANVAPVHQWLA
jgi:hypothetical protein